MTRPPMLAADHIRELTRPFTTTERILAPVMRPLPSTMPPASSPWWEPTGRFEWTLHHVTHEPLLDQINDTVTGNTTGGEVYRAAYGSKPAGRLDALALLHRIDHQSRDLAAAHGLPLTPVRERLTAIAGKLGHRENTTVRSWWATARVLTQHDGPPLSPNVPCYHPQCPGQGSLRVRPDEQIAVCVECQSVWTEMAPDDDPSHTFGRLIEYVRWAVEHLGGPTHWRTDDDATGYPGLGYRVECEDCHAERLDRARHRAQRLTAVREQRVRERVA